MTCLFIIIFCKIIYNKLFVGFFFWQLYGEVGMEGDKGRDFKKEFFFDHSYWSADPKDQHFIKQEQVTIT